MAGPPPEEVYFPRHPHPGVAGVGRAPRDAWRCKGRGPHEFSATGAEFVGTPGEQARFTG
jgi:hypothetical protein